MPQPRQDRLTFLTDDELYSLSSRVGIDDLYRYLDVAWHRRGLSRNPQLTLEALVCSQRWSRLRGEWDYEALFWGLGQRVVIPIPDRVMIRRSPPKGHRFSDGHRTIEWLDATYGRNLYGSWDWQGLIWGYFTADQILALVDHPTLSQYLTASWWLRCHPGNARIDLVFRLGMTGGRLDVNQWNPHILTEEIHPDEILRYPDLPWVTDRLLRNRRLTLELVDFYYQRKYYLSPEQAQTRRKLYSRRLLREIAGTIQWEELRKIPNYDQRPWSRGWLSRNPSLPVRWLREVVDKWPRVYGRFDHDAMKRRSDARSYGIYEFYDCCKRRGIQLLGSATIQDVYFLVWYHAQRPYHTPLALEISQAVHVQGIEVEDFHRLFPERWQHLPGLSLKFDKSYHDLVLRCRK